MNPWTLRYLARIAAGMTLSLELTLAQARELADSSAVRSELIAHGRGP